MRYIKGTINHQLVYTKEKDLVVKEFYDSNFAAYLDKINSECDMCSVRGNVIRWKLGL